MMSDKRHLNEAAVNLPRRFLLACLVLVPAGCGNAVDSPTLPEAGAASPGQSPPPQSVADDLRDWYSRTRPEFSRSVFSETCAYLERRLTEIRNREILDAEATAEDAPWQLPANDDLNLQFDLGVQWTLIAKFEAEPANADQPGDVTSAQWRYPLGDQGTLLIKFEPELKPLPGGGPAMQLEQIQPGDKVHVTATIKSVEVFRESNGRGRVEIVLRDPQTRVLDEPYR